MGYKGGTVEVLTSSQQHEVNELRGIRNNVGWDLLGPILEARLRKLNGDNMDAGMFYAPFIPDMTSSIFYTGTIV